MAGMCDSNGACAAGPKPDDTPCMAEDEAGEVAAGVCLTPADAGTSTCYVQVVDPVCATDPVEQDVSLSTIESCWPAGQVAGDNAASFAAAKQFCDGDGPAYDFVQWNSQTNFAQCMSAAEGCMLPAAAPGGRFITSRNCPTP